jgi:hypothetical protein
MRWNGHLVVALAAHIRARADRFHRDRRDPEYRAPDRLCGPRPRG